jgi:endonuclease/exonuclease/phosphatase family metal-dependent hydrolase
VWVPVFALAVAIFPMMGLCLPWRSAFEPRFRGPSVRVLTCNSDNRDLDRQRFAALVREARPDIVVMQDAWVPYVKDVFDRSRWHVHVEQGLCLASRFPIRGVELFKAEGFGPGLGAAARYALETPGGVVHCFNLHLATPRWGLLAVARVLPNGTHKLESNSDLRREQSIAVSRWASTLEGNVLLAGDFNTPVESTIYRACFSAYSNAFSVAGAGFGSTHRTRHTAVRIDHILTGSQWRVERCWVGPDVGAAHRPVIADLAWRDAGNQQTADRRSSH